MFNGDNNKGKIIDIGNIGKFCNPTIREVLLVYYGLKYNLLSISQLYNKGNNVTYDYFGCMAIKPKFNQIILTISRSGNIYTMNLNNIPSNGVSLLSNKDESWLWYKRITYIHMDHLYKLVRKELVIGFPNLHFEKSRLCDVR